MNPWEAYAFQHQTLDEENNANAQVPSTAASSWPPVTETALQTNDPIIYPGLYSATGFDVVGILVAVMNRPNPQIDLGPVDASCPIIVCDLKLPDQPIVYASDAFLSLTGYTAPEVMGRNCRFLQAPGGAVPARSARQHVDKDTIRRIRRAVERNCEIQLRVPNFRRDGSRFVNLLTIVPVCWAGQGSFDYSVGFQCELEGEV